MRTFTSLDEVAAATGTDLGTSDWVEIDQDRIDRFAEATGDHQWIHVDPERAATGPFGATIAHGYLTLALAPNLSEQVFRLEGFAFAVPYGLDRVRFPAPMPVGERLRLRVRLADVEQIPGGAEIKTELTFEREAGEEPVCVAVAVARVYSA